MSTSKNLTECTPAGPARHDPASAVAQDCCLVQIYPADVIDGMLRLGRGSLVIGREQGCDLVLPDGSVSRRHAELRRNGDDYYLSDLGSTNGTLVNGERVDDRRLETGDCLKFGSFLYKFLAADSIETAYHETVYSALTVDALTGAFNKSYLLDNLKREIARTSRNGRPLAVVMADIDRFKAINDTHGHLVGDEVLREFGRRLGVACRDGDLFARYGGEEFCLLMPDTEAAEARSVAERCRAVVADEPFPTAIGPLDLTASFGAEVLAGGAHSTPSELIGAADARLYEAKASGRNRVR